MKHPMLRLKRAFGRTLEMLGKGAWLLGLLIAAGILLMECLEWLRERRWPAWSTLDSLVWLSGDRLAEPTTPVGEWAREPRSWTGLQYLMSIAPASVGAFAGAMVGMAGGDWGRAVRIASERELYDQCLASAATAKPSESRAAPVTRPAAVTGPLSEDERDVVRWLAVNGTDPTARMVSAMARGLGRSVTEIENAQSDLLRRRYLWRDRGSAQLTDEGVAFCVEQGWTIVTGPKAL